MKELSLEEQKKIVLNILVDFDKVCRNNNIRYTLAYGSLLGAVRHKGFIPWDDDIDIIVAREDFNRLMPILNNELASNHEFISVKNNKGFSAPLAKIVDNNTVLIQLGKTTDSISLGAYIDVFVYDWVPEDFQERKKIFKKAIFLQKIWSFCGNVFEHNNRLINGIRYLLSQTGAARLASLYLNKWAENNEYEKIMMAGVVYSSYDKEQNTMKYIDYCNLKEYNFEGHRFLGVSESDFYLKQWYGDYMELPPLEQRVSNHTTVVYKKEE